MDRRQFLTRSGAAAASAAAAGLTLPGIADAAGHRRNSDATTARLEASGALQTAVTSDPAARLPAVPFHGPHQAGITQPPPPAACFVVANVTAQSRAELTDLFRTLTDRARFLTTGGMAPMLGPDIPPSDSGTLGLDIPADGLTVTLGAGASLFANEKFGLESQIPKRLTTMEPFPNDNLQPAITGGDLILQFCAGSPDTVLHAVRDIYMHTRGGMQIAYRMDGFGSPARPAGVPRNHFGHMDGIANPNVADPLVADRLLWVTERTDEPAWARGGTYHVFRIIRMFTEFWDRVSLNEQQTMIGRYRETGVMLGGAKTITDVTDFAADPKGRKMPLTAHIRLANPRTAETADQRILRRGYNYDNGIDESGNLNVGLLFNCFQQDLVRQFIANQTRLIGEPMVDYVQPQGGGYFFTLPGVRDRHDWYGSSLLG